LLFLVHLSPLIAFYPLTLPLPLPLPHGMDGFALFCPAMHQLDHPDVLI